MVALNLLSWEERCKKNGFVVFFFQSPQSNNNRHFINVYNRLNLRENERWFLLVANARNLKSHIASDNGQLRNNNNAWFSHTQSNWNCFAIRMIIKLDFCFVLCEIYHWPTSSIIMLFGRNPNRIDLSLVMREKKNNQPTNLWKNGDKWNKRYAFDNFRVFDCFRYLKKKALFDRIVQKYDFTLDKYIKIANLSFSVNDLRTLFYSPPFEMRGRWPLYLVNSQTEHRITIIYRLIYTRSGNLMYAFWMYASIT